MQKIFQLSRAELDKEAESYFRSFRGVSKRNAPNPRLKDIAHAAREEMAGISHFPAIIRAFSSDIIHRDGLRIEGRFFPCRALAQLDKGHVQAVYAFALTTGELKSSRVLQKRAIDAMYANFWAAAYLYAAGNALRYQLGSNHGPLVYISEAIGPGYYDMGADKIADLLDIVGSGKIGVSLQGMTMIPLQSRAGFFLAVEGKGQVDFLDKRCQYCPKDSGGCGFCAYGQGEILRYGKDSGEVEQCK